MRSTLLVLLIVVPPMVLAGVMRTRETPRRFAEIEEGRLYRGGFPSAAQIENLSKDKKIQTVISLTSDEHKPRDIELDAVIKTLKLKHYRFPMEGDGRGELAVLDHAADALAQTQDQPIFFHCSAGDKRTSATLAAYWMKHKGKSLRQSLDDLTRDFGMEFDGEDKKLADHLRDYAAYIGLDVNTKPATQPDQS